MSHLFRFLRTMYGKTDHSILEMTNHSYFGVPHAILTNPSDFGTPFHSKIWIPKGLQTHVHFTFISGVRNSEKWHFTDMKKDHSAFDNFFLLGKYIFGRHNPLLGYATLTDVALSAEFHRIFSTGCGELSAIFVSKVEELKNLRIPTKEFIRGVNTNLPYLFSNISETVNTRTV